jgi:uncharacterized protein (DUF111 family)
MKKGRPGIILNVLSQSDNLTKIGEFILENTSAIGLRYFPVERMELLRKNVLLETKFGVIRAKEVTLPSGKMRRKLENDEVFRISKENNLSSMDLLEILNKI